jgi:hypothetical protein
MAEAALVDCPTTGQRVERVLQAVHAALQGDRVLLDGSSNAERQAAVARSNGLVRICEQTQNAVLSASGVAEAGELDGQRASGRVSFGKPEVEMD